MTFSPISPESTPPSLHIGIEGYTYADLYRPERLRDLAELFYSTVRESDPALWDRFDHYRTTQGVGMKPEAISAILVDTAPHLSAFITELFQVQEHHGLLRRVVQEELTVFTFKREFVQRRALKRYRTSEGIDTAAVREAVTVLRHEAFADWFLNDDLERATAQLVLTLVDLEKSLAKAGPEMSEQLRDEAAAIVAQVTAARAQHPALDALLPSANPAEDPAPLIGALLGLFEQWIAVEYEASAHSGHGSEWVSLRTPANLDFSHLVHLEPVPNMPAGAWHGDDRHLRHRDGFALTDLRHTHREVMDEIEYCIYCHERDRDSCSKGLREKDGSKKKNPLGITLNGCPLDEKISEMQTMKHRGDGLAALSLVMIDNPMCPGTGHRICNDCMKGCIYQKQEPVNIPQNETGVLTEVLDYPFGFEIYSLLTRWNPLNVQRPFPLPYNGKKVLVVGLGPAGYTLAHYLVNEGFGVVGIDGLKIEPLPERWTGSATALPEPIYDWRAEMEENLNDRIVLGFGGVSEYGITVRWDKNFLKIINTALARRRTFQYYGGIRFGGTLTIDDAWRLGFDHIAIATGAGKPTIVPMRNNLVRGIRQASDFLMALQLSGAFKPSGLANLQVRLPALVIGGGLTGVDTTTEMMAYYPVQVERTLHRYEVLCAEIGEAAFWNSFDAEEREIMEEFIAHGREVRMERDRAASEGRAPNFTALVRGWGGVSLVYRKSINDSPAYRLNHEEVTEALDEGIYIIENLSPVEAVSDDYGAVKEMIFERQAVDETGRWRATGEMITLPARTVMVAAGTQPNTIIERETPGAFAYDEWRQYFAPHRTAEAVEAASA